MLNRVISAWRWQKSWQSASSKHQNEAALAYLNGITQFPKGALSEQNLLAVDLEMDGLDASNGRVLSIGWVEIQNLTIKMDTARHIVIQHQGIDLQQSAPIHQLFAEHLEQGISGQQAMEELLHAMTGRLALFHHAPLDLAFLRRLCVDCFATSLPMLYLDTITIEQAYLARTDQSNLPLNLEATRHRYGLPHFQAHNACLDAIATAELFLAQVARLSAASSDVRDRLAFAAR